jgi:signal transduction histidine kinase
VEQSAHLFSHSAAEKHLSLDVFIDQALPAGVVGDPVRVAQVLTNLIGNAIKFTEQGGVTVRLMVEHRSAESVTVRCSVKDTGIGIPPEHQESLFKLFSQVDGSDTRKYGGTDSDSAIYASL